MGMHPELVLRIRADTVGFFFSLAASPLISSLKRDREKPIVERALVRANSCLSIMLGRGSENKDI
jgi:hypothetical protein